MKGLFLSLTALILVSISSDAQAQAQQVKPANGRFYCTGMFDFNLRMDVDFFGNSARLEIYDTKTGKLNRLSGRFDRFRSTILTTHYQLSSLARIEFPSDYQVRRWFTVVYQDTYGWNRFDCNHF